MVLNQSGKLINLDLREVILLNNQLTMLLFCNSKLISNKCKPDKPLKLQSNRGTMMINHIANIGEGQSVWFSKKAITNIMSLKHVKQMYPVLYECEDDTFTIHRKDRGLGNMVFRMHKKWPALPGPTRRGFQLHHYSGREQDSFHKATNRVSRKMPGAYTQAWAIHP